MIKGNTVVVAALVCAFFLYGKLVCVHNTGFMSLVPAKTLCMVKGKLVSSPEKMSSKAVYSAILCAEQATGTMGNYAVHSSAKGFLQVTIPSSLIDFYSGVCFEQGETLCLKGNWSEQRNCFQVSSLESCQGYASNLVGTLYHVRARCRISFKRLVSAWNDAGGLIISLLSGSRVYLNDDVAEAFRNAGLSHILALSGMHLSFMAALSGGFFAKLFGKKYEAVARLFGILFFVWFAGLSPSLFRAFLFSMVIAVLQFFKCRVEEDCFLPVLAFVFMMHIVLRPQDVFTLAFMLSYSALLGILVCSTAFMRYGTFLFPSSIAHSVSSSVAAFVFTAPISFSVFGAVHPFGIFATVIVSPLVSVFLCIAVAGILFSLMIPFLSPAFSCILNALYCLILFFVRFFARG
ncbi:MAG: ComEC/Rec2 family competence protein [Treponema sp.]|nr:ComEC/Rec2 family competence protein [Treponema sp.]